MGLRVRLGKANAFWLPQQEVAFTTISVMDIFVKSEPKAVVCDSEPIALKDFLPYQLSVVAHKIARRTAGIAREHGLSNLSQWRVLAAIAEAPGRTANEVVAVTPMDKGLVSRAVKSLLELGLIYRKASVSDGRLGHLFLSAAGEAIYSEIAVHVRNIDHELQDAMGKNKYQTITATMARLIQALETE